MLVWIYFYCKTYWSPIYTSCPDLLLWSIFSVNAFHSVIWPAPHTNTVSHFSNSVSSQLKLWLLASWNDNMIHQRDNSKCNFQSITYWPHKKLILNVREAFRWLAFMQVVLTDVSLHSEGRTVVHSTPLLTTANQSNSWRGLLAGAKIEWKCVLIENAHPN